MLRSLASALLATIIAITPAMAADKAAPFTAAQKSAMDSAIKDFIIANPQILISSVEAYYNKQNETKKAQEGPLTQLPAGLVDAPHDPYIGPKDAKVAIVEFFDYNCGYCKQVATDLDTLMDEDKTVKVVFKELPILSDTSELAARYALASNKQGKYREYHMALLQHQGPINEAFLVDTAKAQGLDVEKLKKDANTQEVRDVLNKNVELARELGVRGTPFFVIGRERVPGAIGLTRMKEILAKERGEPAPTAAAAPAAAPTPAPTPAAEAPKAAEAAPVATDAASKQDAEAQVEIDKARAETRAMIEEIKAEALKMQTQALEAQKAAEAAQKKAAVKK